MSPAHQADVERRIKTSEDALNRMFRDIVPAIMAERPVQITLLHIGGDEYEAKARIQFDPSVRQLRDGKQEAYPAQSYIPDILLETLMSQIARRDLENGALNTPDDTTTGQQVEFIDVKVSALHGGVIGDGQVFKTALKRIFDQHCGRMRQ